MVKSNGSPLIPCTCITVHTSKTFIDRSAFLLPARYRSEISEVCVPHGVPEGVVRWIRCKKAPLRLKAHIRFRNLEGFPRVGRRTNTVVNHSGQSHSILIHSAKREPCEYMTCYRKHSDETNLVCDVKSIMIWRQSHIGLLSSVGASDVSGAQQ